MFTRHNKNHPSDENITFRRRFAEVSVSTNGADCNRMYSSPRNVKVRDEVDGTRQSTMAAFEQPALEPQKNELPQERKSRNSTSSLASVFRTRAGSPIERVRKLISRTSSKSAIQKAEQQAEEKAARENAEKELERMRFELSRARIELDETKHELEKEKMRRMKLSKSTQTDTQLKESATMTTGHENKCREPSSPEIICLDDETDKEKLKKALRQLEDERMEHKAVYRDFLTVVQVAERQRDEVQNKLDDLLRATGDDDDWRFLMAEHRNTLRRNILLLWVKKRLDAYSEQLDICNFSSDWADCRAFCALIYDFFPETMPDVTGSPIVGDCIARCRSAFRQLGIKFDEKSLGITSSSWCDDSTSSSTISLVDWRYIMDTVFCIYKKGVLGR